MKSLLKLVPTVIRDRLPVDLKNISAAVHVLDQNPAYRQAREDILRDIVEQWLWSEPNATDERERLYMKAHALSQLERQFNVYLAKNAMKDKQNAG